MAIKFVAKKFYTFAELSVHWQCEITDLRQAVLDGDLVPSLYIKGTDFHELAFAIFKTYLVPQTLASSVDEDGFRRPNYVFGFKYLIHPYRQDAFDGQFSFFSEKPTGFVVGDLCHGLEDNVTIDEILSRGFVMAEEVARIERASEDKPIAPPLDKPLGTSERNQLLKMVLGMAIDSYRYDPVAKKSEATKQIADDLAKLGIGIDPDTVRKYLKEAVNTVTFVMPKP